MSKNGCKKFHTIKHRCSFAHSSYHSQGTCNICGFFVLKFFFLHLAPPALTQPPAFSKTPRQARWQGGGGGGIQPWLVKSAAFSAAVSWTRGGGGGWLRMAPPGNLSFILPLSVHTHGSAPEGQGPVTDGIRSRNRTAGSTFDVTLDPCDLRLLCRFIRTHFPLVILSQTIDNLHIFTVIYLYDANDVNNFRNLSFSCISSFTHPRPLSLQNKSLCLLIPSFFPSLIILLIDHFLLLIIFHACLLTPSLRVLSSPFS